MTVAAVHHIIGLTTIVRERRLPVKGTVRAHVNQKVSPGDIVADASWAREHIFLDVARLLFRRAPHAARTAASATIQGPC